MSWVMMNLYKMQALSQLQNAYSGFFANQDSMMSLLDKAGSFANMGMDYMKNPKFGDFMNTARKADMQNAQYQTQISVLDAQYKMYDKYLQKELQREAKTFDTVG